MKKAIESMELYFEKSGLCRIIPIVFITHMKQAYLCAFNDGYNKGKNDSEVG
jgi:hypothetical protein